MDVAILVQLLRFLVRQNLFSVESAALEGLIRLPDRLLSCLNEFLLDFLLRVSFKLFYA